MARKLWGKNSSLAYESFSKAADDLRDYGLRRDLGEAYRADQEVTPGAIVGAEDGFSNEDAMVTGTKYGLGGKTQDTPYTPEQIQQFRMGRIRDVYAKAGMPDKAIDMEVKASGLRRDQRAEAREVRQDRLTDDLDAIQQQYYALIADPIGKGVPHKVKLFNDDADSYGGAGQAGLDAHTARTADGGVLAWRVNRETGEMVGQARHFTPQAVAAELQSEMLAKLAARDTTGKWYGIARTANVDDQRIALEREKLNITRQQADTMERYRGDQGRLIDAQIRNLGLRGTGARATGPQAQLQAMRDRVQAHAMALMESGQIKDEKEALAYAWAVATKDPASNPRNQRPTWKVSPDGAFRANDDGDVEDWVVDPKTKQGGWVLRGPGLLSRLDKALGQQPSSAADPSAADWNRLSGYDAGQGFDTPPAEAPSWWDRFRSRFRSSGQSPAWDVSPRDRARGLNSRFVDVQ